MSVFRTGPVRTPKRGVLALVLAVTAPAGAGTIEVAFEAPTLDRWMYPFNGTPGTRTWASVFGNFEFDDFDNRDGQMLVAYDTFGQIPPGRGVDQYQVLAATLTIMYDGQVEIFYDETQDPFQVFLDPEDAEFAEDEDAGHPLEVYGTGFRHGFDASFPEDGPFGELGIGQRNLYALGFDPEGAPIDVSNSVRDRFDPHPWAIGQIASLAPGEIVPGQAEYVFPLDLDDPHIQAYLRAALDAGRLWLTVTSLHLVTQQAGSFPTIYSKEHPFIAEGIAAPARLDLVVALDGGNPADVNGDGVVDVQDLTEVILSWGECPGCPADTNGDGVVDVQDLTEVILNWGS